MSEASSIARPYAKAIFELAREQSTLDAWAAKLSFLSQISADPLCQAYLQNPQHTSEEAVLFFQKVMDEEWDKDAAGLVGVMAHFERLSVLPQVYELFLAYKREEESCIEADVTSAEPLSASNQSQFKAALQKQSGKTVELNCHENPDLLGGAIVQVGDKVLDGSLRRRLNQLAQNLI